MPQELQKEDVALFTFPQVLHFGLCETVIGATTSIVPIMPTILRMMTCELTSDLKPYTGVNFCSTLDPATVIPASFVEIAILLANISPVAAVAVAEALVALNVAFCADTLVAPRKDDLIIGSAWPVDPHTPLPNVVFHRFADG